MAKAVFDTKSGSGYDDRIEERYHFPARRNYLDVAHAAVGDWIIYREPQRNQGRRAYVGAARVTAVDRDLARSDHAYARVADFIAFEPPVAFAGSPNGGYWEEPLRAVADPGQVGMSLRGASMRPLADADFSAIVSAGLRETLAPPNLVRYAEPGFQDTDGLAPTPPLTGYPELPPADWTRRVEQMLVNRKIRDANFRRVVCEAYDDTCAVTGLRIINGGGRSEVQAAHIWPVAEGGPDVVTNGLALSGTVHWLFDRHLISLTDDYRLLVSHNKVPPELRGLFAGQMERIRLPTDERLRPNPAYVRRHREGFEAA